MSRYGEIAKSLENYGKKHGQNQTYSDENGLQQKYYCFCCDCVSSCIPEQEERLEELFHEVFTSIEEFIEVNDLLRSRFKDGLTKQYGIKLGDNAFIIYDSFEDIEIKFTNWKEAIKIYRWGQLAIKDEHINYLRELGR